MLRSLLQNIARAAMAPDWPGKPLAVWSGPHGWLNVQRQVALEKRFARRSARLFANQTVLGGPLAGLRYPAAVAHGSALPPKLLGTYESELHPVWRELRGNAYDDVVDVGFAEGYYLVGFARWFQNARIWGFDPSHEAHRLCEALALANDVAPARLRLGESATEENVAAALAGRSLIICDCEGCEAELFAASRIAGWRRSDLVIEAHDFIRPGVSIEIASRLEATHRVSLIPTATPGSQIALIPSDLRTKFSDEELLRLVSEGRPAAQTWIVARPHGTP